MERHCWRLKCEKPICKNQPRVAAEGTGDVLGLILSACPYVVVWDDCRIYGKLANLENRRPTAAGNRYARV